MKKNFSDVKIDDFWYQKFSEKKRPKSDVPKSDAFLGIWLNSKCVTFWTDSVFLNFQHQATGFRWNLTQYVWYFDQRDYRYDHLVYHLVYGSCSERAETSRK